MKFSPPRGALSGLALAVAATALVQPTAGSRRPGRDRRTRSGRRAVRHRVAGHPAHRRCHPQRHLRLRRPRHDARHRVEHGRGRGRRGAGASAPLRDVDPHRGVRHGRLLWRPGLPSRGRARQVPGLRPGQRRRPGDVRRLRPGRRARAHGDHLRSQCRPCRQPLPGSGLGRLRQLVQPGARGARPLRCRFRPGRPGHRLPAEAAVLLRLLPDLLHHRPRGGRPVVRRGHRRHRHRHHCVRGRPARSRLAALAPGQRRHRPCGCLARRDAACRWVVHRQRVHSRPQRQQHRPRVQRAGRSRSVRAGRPGGRVGLRGAGRPAAQRFAAGR